MTSTGATGYTVPANGEQMSFGPSMAFVIPVANGVYEVALRFMEPNINGTGQRVFNVFANDQQVLTNLDIFAHVGLQRPLERAFQVAVVDGAIRLELKSLPGSRPAVLSRITAVPTGM